MATHDLVLPDLRPRTHFPTLPKRYEETKPVATQNFSHRQILNIGRDIHSQVLNRCSLEQTNAIEAAEQAVWARAEILKKEAISKAVKRVKAEHEQFIQKLNKVHEHTLKEEIIRVSAMMDKLRLAEVAQTKRQGEKLLREAVQRTEQLWQNKLLEAVEASRCEERKSAADKAMEVASQHQQEVVSVLKQAAQDRADALATLGQQKDQERDSAITLTREQEQDQAQKKLLHLKNMFEQQITILHTKISEHKGNISQLREEMNRLTEHREKIIEELLHTRDEFQKFIDIVRPFNKSEESRYLLPPVQSI